LFWVFCRVLRVTKITGSGEITPHSRISVINFNSHHASRRITTTTMLEHTKQQVNKSGRAVVMHSNGDFNAFRSVQDDENFMNKMLRWLLLC